MPILTPEERVGTDVAGKYRLERIVAGGGMATVYAGLHEWTHRAVAVKILNYEYARDEEIVRRFLQEARAASQLKHPNVVDVLDMGREPDGTVYLVMELLEGETLKARMRRGVTVDDFPALLAPVMRAVARAHEKGVTHRDLKPENVFLAESEDGTITPKLLDFGIAKVGSGGDSSTRTGVMVGTPHYMAPEQIRGERDVGPPADVWSMGVVLFACLSGRLPFEAESAPGVIAKVMVERAPPLAPLAPSAPPEIVAVVERAMERDPTQRFSNMGEMLGALEDALASARAPRPGAAPVPAGAEVASAATLIREPSPYTTIDPPSVPADPSSAPVDPSGPSADPPSAPTPFAWAGAAPPEPAPSGRGWVVVAGAAIAVVALAAIGVGTWWAMSATPETTATPLPVTAAGGPAESPSSSGSGSGSVVGTGTEPETGTEPATVAEPGTATEAVAEPAAETGIETGTATEAVAEPAAEAGTATVTAAETAAETEAAGSGEPDAAEAGATATTERDATRREPRTATSGGRARSTGTAEARPRTREPRRGTRGALILH